VALQEEAEEEALLVEAASLWMEAAGAEEAHQVVKLSV